MKCLLSILYLLTIIICESVAQSARRYMFIRLGQSLTGPMLPLMVKSQAIYRL